MRVMGHNALAVIVAAIVIYALEFLIFAVMISPEQYGAMVGLSENQMHGDRMPVGAIMPVLTAIGLSMAIKWRSAPGWMSGVMAGVLVAIFVAFPASLYGYVYGSHTETFVGVNLAHFLVCYAAAGAVLGAWK